MTVAGYWTSIEQWRSVHGCRKTGNIGERDTRSDCQQGLKQVNEGKEITLENFGSILVPDILHFFSSTTLVY